MHAYKYRSTQLSYPTRSCCKEGSLFRCGQIAGSKSAIELALLPGDRGLDVIETRNGNLDFDGATTRTTMNSTEECIVLLGDRAQEQESCTARTLEQTLV